MKGKILLILLLLSKMGLAQINLVLNPSFENYIPFDTSLHINYYLTTLPPWHQMDTSKGNFGPFICSTLITKKSTCHLPIPAYGWGGGGGYQYPRTGNFIINAIEMADTLYFSNRNYPIGVLRETLHHEKSYCVTFYTNLALPTDHGVGINRIGAYLSNADIDTVNNHSKVYRVIPQIECSQIITDTANWTKVQGMFTPQGGESRITLGNFYPNYMTSTQAVRTTWTDGNLAQYFFDDVSVVESTAKVQAGNDTVVVAGSRVTLGKGITDGLPCEWQIQGSAAALWGGSNPVVSPIQTTTYIVSMDLCGNVTTDTVVVRVVPKGIEQLKLDDKRLIVYPNPANANLTISRFDNLKMIEVQNVLGQVVFSQPINNSTTQQINIAALPKGIYFLKATNTNGFSQVVKFVKE